MKFLMKYTAMMALLLCAICAEAQSFTKLHSNAQVSDQVLTAPSYQQSNSLLDRKISVHATPSVGLYRQEAQPQATGSGIHTATGVSARQGLQLSGASSQNSSKPFSTLSGSSSVRLSGIGATTVGGTAVVRDESKGGSLDLGTEDLQPGQLVPMGNTIVPLIILLLCYCLFLLVRGEAREENEELA